MKRLLAFTLALVLLLSLASCAAVPEETAPEAQTPAATQPAAEEETTAQSEPPAPQEPEWEPATVRAGYGEVLYKVFEADTPVNILGKFRHYYVVEGEDVDLLVEQRFIRLDSEAPYKSRTAYAKSGAEVFETAYLRGEPAATLKANTKLTVLEGKEDWVYVEWEDGSGYMDAQMVSKWRTGSSSGGNSGSGGSGKGPADGTDVPIGSLSAFGGSYGIQLLGVYRGPEMEDTTGGPGNILAKDTEGYICLAVYGDEVKVTDRDDQTVTIWLEEELYGKLPGWLVRQGDDAAYESWTGYSRWNGIVYEEYQMRNEAAKLKTNQKVTVLDELETCYVVEYNGQIGYMELDKVSETKIPSSTGGSGGSGGSGGGSGSTWTPPKK